MISKSAAASIRAMLSRNRCRTVHDLPGADLCIDPLERFDPTGRWRTLEVVLLIHRFTMPHWQ